MSDRVYEDSRIWRVSQGRTDVEVYAFDPKGTGKVIISIDGPDTGEGCHSIALTAEEATLLKEFLIRKGY
jgi:hypothetical protein